jgi:hypothetical protein
MQQTSKLNEFSAMKVVPRAMKVAPGWNLSTTTTI